MTRTRASAVAVVAAGLAVVLHVFLSSAGFGAFLSVGSVCAIIVFVGSTFGWRCGGAAGLCAGVVLSSLRWQLDGELSPASATVVLVLAGIGLLAGRVTDALRVRLGESGRNELAARRETYRLRRDLEDLVSERAALTVPPPAPPPVEGPAEVEPVADSIGLLDAALRKIASSLNETRLFATVLESIAQVVGADRVTLHLHERRLDRFLDGIAHPAGAPVPVGDRESLLRSALRRRELLVRDDDREVFDHAGEQVHFVAPVFDRVILAGFLVVEFEAPPPAGARETFSVLTGAFGLALSAVRLVVRIDAQERTDTLTGLPSVSEIRESLGRSLERGRTGVLLVAADGIRNVNEAYGRKAGDKAVQALSKLLALEVGAEGTVGRYGGATMLVVLPGMQLDASVAVAERVLRRVPTSIAAGPEGLAKPLTASIGASAATVGPVDALLGQAESALKAAQDAGGGRCVTPHARGAIHA